MSEPAKRYRSKTRIASKRNAAKAHPAKPEYAVPTMAEIEDRTGANGFKVVSTFSGCGGSCLGFRMAGFEVAWASEFVEAAREVYRLNHPTPLDERDIREVTPEDILLATNLEVGELDVLEGSPPCASFSMAGKREKKWGEVSAYSDVEQRSDDLFFEYARLLRGLQPKCFVAENVKGLTVGKAKGYFIEILEALEECGYQVEAQVLDAQWLGVPQRRQRVIFMGVRNDLGVAPSFPEPLPYRYSLREVLGVGVSFPRAEKTECRTRTDEDLPAPTVGAQGMRVELDEPAPTVLTHGRPLTQSELVAIVEGPSIENYAIGKEAKNLRPGEGSDKYLNLVRPDESAPCPTVTQLGGSNPGVASVIHPDGTRKFSIAELKRICGFPDDFQLTGTYAQQWERLGRAVPPPMMAAVARAVRDNVLRKLAE